MSFYTILIYVHSEFRLKRDHAKELHLVFVALFKSGNIQES